MNAVDVAAAKKLQDTIAAAVEVALDACLSAGWEPSQLELQNGPEAFQQRLVIKRPRPSWDVHVFEVMVTFELDATPPHVNVIERWLTEIPCGR